MERKKQILVVEDHDLLLLAIRDILEVEGYEVVTATDGLDALEVMQDFTPDLIVADISMPRMNGYEFFEAVHARPEWVPIPFIFLTARAERGDVLKGKALGAEDYITKPFDPQELVVVVSSRIGRAKAIREATETEFEDLKQQIITLLSHELRTPLTSVYGYTELALEEATDLPPGDFQQFLMGIKKGADRLHNLVEDLLMVVRQESKQLTKEFEMLGSVHQNVGAVVSQAARLHTAVAITKGIEIKTDIVSDLPPVRIYEQFLIDGMSRLFDNAIKFSRKKGKTITVKADSDDEMVRISITDEGVGISETELTKLFERFRQINRAKMEQQGTGLGLYIAQSLIECMGGKITVESEFGVGSTFTIHLPVVE
jgi:signal transduction histidine kinase